MSAALPNGAQPHLHRPRRLVLFDVDGTLTPARQSIQANMLEELQRVRDRTGTHVGFVGGSDMAKIREQLEAVGGPKMEEVFDYGFAENGLTAWAAPPRLAIPPSAVAEAAVVPDKEALGAAPAKPVRSTPSASSSAPTRPTTQFAPVSFITWLGEERYKQLVKFALRYISELDLPVMRGTFIEFRKGMINISPIGRNASVQERHDFEAYDKIHRVRATFVDALKAKFGKFGLRFSIGGQISFDVFPDGWDKRYALQRLEEEYAQIQALEKSQQETAELVSETKHDAEAIARTANVPLWDWDEIHFFGDKTYAGGNDHEIFEDERTVGHSVNCPEDTIVLLQQLFPTLES